MLDYRVLTFLTLYDEMNYCYSGARSRQTTTMLQHMGYTKVQNIGGIAAYQGKVERYPDCG